MGEVKGAVYESRKSSFMGDLLRRLIREKPLGVIGGVIVLVLLLTGIFADFIAPYGYNEVDLAARLDPPSATHFLGTDNLGRDLLSRIIYGARISLYVGLGASAIAAFVSTIIGTVSGYFSGIFDAIAQRFVDAFMSFPPIFIYLTIMAILGPGLTQVIVVMGLVVGINESRVVRSAAISARENVYIDAARAVGAKTLRILLHHLLPNIMAVIIIIFTVRLGSMIIIEATLSFLGFGIPPPTPSWGGMLSGAARQYMYNAPWLALWPGIALALSVYGINMLGDALRDLLDPRLRGGLGRYEKIRRKKPVQ